MQIIPDKFTSSKFYVKADNLREVMGLVWDTVCAVVANKPLLVTVAKAQSQRSLQQNNLMWRLLTDISKQCFFPVIRIDSNGVEFFDREKITPEEVKARMTASLDENMRFCEIDNGSRVYLGKSTSRMTAKEMSDLIELLYAFGAQNNVVFTDNRYEDMPEVVRGL